EFPRPRQFIALRVLHAVVREMADVERIGQIVEMRQLVGNLELSRLFRHFRILWGTPVKQFCWLTAIDTSINQLLVLRIATRIAQGGRDDRPRNACPPAHLLWL